MHNRLEIDSFTMAYGNRPVLTDIYLKCETGDIIGLFGRNGSGKSTLLKILFGIEKGDSKFVRINENRIGSRAESFRAISYLSQDVCLPRYLRVSQLIGLALAGERVSDLTMDPIIAPVLSQRVSSLSGGELRYLEIKLLLNLDSMFVLLDEPFNGMSPIMVERVRELIKAKSHTKGIIITDHDYTNVLEIANRYLVMVDGTLKQVSSRDGLVQFGYLSR